MGEQKEAAKNDGEKKPAAAAAPDAGAKKDDGIVPIILKLDLHCEGCVKKIKRAITKSFQGIDKVTADIGANKLTVIGKVDPVAVKEKVEQKINKKVELVSPLPKKDAGGDKKPAEAKPAEKKPAEDKKPAEVQKPKQSTVVLKIRLHCEGCIHKIKKIISKIKGVESVEIDAGKDLVTVKGTMDVKELTPYLQTKLRRSVDVVPPPAKKEDGAKAPAGDKKDAGAGDKKGKDAAPAGEEKKKEEKKEGDAKAPAAAAAAAPAKVEVNKMEYFGYGQPSTMYYEDPISAHNRYVMEAHAHQAFVSENYAANHGYPMNNGYGYGAPMNPYQAPQMFSDENPNGCSVM
ncbi:heavy metal-associated isoprenylated plant protein 6-like [Humulus lupulus]|uniref:heavy metal-associated isoprenylated plant protein 6-like n=1 Tax=Humulus lupulus TaxID=3486 RepID=UPI002B416782|nr:heavy metal-associated isoprenylated plant protein 6-like [Humulus lupulus]